MTEKAERQKLAQEEENDTDPDYEDNYMNNFNMNNIIQCI
jgi:hypothetical protein